MSDTVATLAASTAASAAECVGSTAMTIWIVVGLLLVGLGLVASQLFRLKDWLNKPAPPSDPPSEHPDEPDT
ncbi:hypothetical protein MSZK_45050 [Mycobacterium sp. shizuoka-1]|nr:hypothetical protein MSZK_45050 [Mycobacterium sp. shizuoka-1]